MKINYVLNDNNIILNLNKEVCRTSTQLLDSTSFYRVLSKYVDYLSENGFQIYEKLNNGETNLTQDLISLFKQLLVQDSNAIKSYNFEFNYLLENKQVLNTFIEMFYNYWRKLTRFSIIDNYANQIKNQDEFIRSHNEFNNLILTTYREISQNLMYTKTKIYRQLTAGVNAGIILNKMNNQMLGKYSFLNSISIVESVVLHPPFITYPKQNKRSGSFQELKVNPLIDLKIDENNFTTFAIRVGKLNGLVCVNSKSLDLALGIINIFELIEVEEVNATNYDFIYLFGNPNSDEVGYYYDDEENVYVATIADDDLYDYFGYIKKMVLTLHNLKQMKNNSLPIHGSMFKLTTKENITKNICLIGDSGAGKSETIEALNIIAKDSLKNIQVIFDDMGVFFEKDNKICANGTEIGAFVRLDDLDQGYPYREIDRAIFMNPNKQNSRLIIPIADFDQVINDEPIDYVFYANNYEDKDNLEIFTEIEEVKNIFIEGKRKAKGTTQETGIVTTFFSNPFGAIQNKEETQDLVNLYFHRLQKQGTKFGQIYTKLAIEGFEQNGPIQAAKEIITIINKG